MNLLARLASAIASLLPVPRSLDDTPPAADPLVDVAALETFGREQLAQFGPGQSHGGAAPLPTHYALADAEEAREAERRQVRE